MSESEPLPPPSPLRPDEDNEDIARAVVEHLDAQPAKEGRLISNAFGTIFAFGPELEQLVIFRELIGAYALQKEPKRPLCLGVFGPPGSGKSTAVKQVVEKIRKSSDFKELDLPLTEVNLTQVTHPGELAGVLARIAGEQDKDTVPIVFFDEFDAARDGARFGWLGWFLAPMNDGAFVHQGALVRLRRAVYVFAGGTAETLRAFSEPPAAGEFRFAKGPDFVSRLRGVLEVKGPNHPPRMVRRATILHYELNERLKKQRAKEQEQKEKGQREQSGGKNGKEAKSPAGGGEEQNQEQPPVKFSVDPGLLRSLLGAGRYRHGARSIAALVEMSTVNTSGFGWDDLPASSDFMNLHIDRGPLDPRRIGGAVAFSGKPPAPTGEEALTRCWSAVANRLWDEGATLAYAGKWDIEGEQSLTAHLFRELQSRAAELHPSRHPDDGGQVEDEPVEPRLRTFMVKGASESSLPAATDPSRELMQVHYVPAAEKPTLTEWQKSVVEEFRRRLESTECSVARFAVGGRMEGYAGRMPGIAEEVMLSLVHGHPVYVAGHFGGAAHEIGVLLGLSSTRSGEIPAAITDERRKDLESIEPELRPAPWRKLPITARDAAIFLQKHAFGGPLWPYNGLSRDENRRLYLSDDADEIAELVVTGLRRRFSPPEERPPRP